MSQDRLVRTGGELQAQRSMLQLLCTVSVWRTAATRILPECGAAGWFAMLCSLLPGLLLALLLRRIMAWTGAPALTEAMRACMGSRGAMAGAFLLAALLVTEGVTSLTALLTVFTQGVGTSGTQFTLALLTGLVMLFALHREGLPRAVALLRWGVVTASLLLAAFAIGDARPEHLIQVPEAYAERILPAVVSTPWAGWPLVLLLTNPVTTPRGQLRSGVLPIACATGAVLLTTLVVPPYVLVHREALAHQLLLPAWYAANALRVIWLCLLMICFFMSIAACVQLAADHLSSPFKKTAEWLPNVLLAGLVLTQAADVKRLWQVLPVLEGALLLILAGMSLLMMTIALFRRRRG